MSDPDPLAKIPLFEFLSDEDRRLLAKDVEEIHYRKGQYIFQEGDPAEYFHVVTDGAVKCTKSSPQGKDFTLKVLLAGDLFCCEAAVFDGTPHPGCALPMSEVRILRIRKQAYFDLLQRNPTAALQVIKYLGKRLYEAQENTKVLALDRAEQRLAALLLQLAERSGIPDPEGLRLTVRLTRQDLADMAGLSMETTIRIMSRFKQDGLVLGTAKRITIRDIGRLKALAAAETAPTSSLIRLKRKSPPATPRTKAF